MSLKWRLAKMFSHYITKMSFRHDVQGVCVHVCVLKFRKQNKLNSTSRKQLFHHHNPSIHYLYGLFLEGRHWARDRVHPRQLASQSKGWHTDRQPFKLTLTPTDILAVRRQCQSPHHHITIHHNHHHFWSYSYSLWFHWFFLSEQNRKSFTLSLLHTQWDCTYSLSPFLTLHSLSNYLWSEHLVLLHCVSELFTDHNIWEVNREYCPSCLCLSLLGEHLDLLHRVFEFLSDCDTWEVNRKYQHLMENKRCSAAA